MPEPQPAGDTQIVARTATAPKPACLVHIHPPGPAAGRRYPLEAGTLLIGRADDRDVRPDDPGVSRRHARIEPDAGGHSVTDLGSANGTFVNEARVGPDAVALRDGDYLRVGGHVYRYLAGGNLEAEYHEEIRRLTVEDPLTRLPNRRALDEFLAREVARAVRHARPLSVLLVDLDRFKAVNDTHGHPCGDAVLREVGAVLRAHARTEDLAARYGGEEFAVVLVEADHAAALSAGERVRAAVAGLALRYEGHTLALSVSVGVATVGPGAEAPADLLHLADGRLYAAKRAGRNRVVGASDDEDLWQTHAKSAPARR